MKLRHSSSSACSTTRCRSSVGRGRRACSDVTRASDRLFSQRSRILVNQSFRFIVLELFRGAAPEVPLRRSAAVFSEGPSLDVNDGVRTVEDTVSTPLFAISSTPTERGMRARTRATREQTPCRPRASCERSTLPEREVVRVSPSPRPRNRARRAAECFESQRSRISSFGAFGDSPPQRDYPFREARAWDAGRGQDGARQRQGARAGEESG